MNVLSILVAAFGIGLLIFVHELGHFLAARLAGVRVEVFSLGFGPRMWGFQWRQTDFRVSLVPFGGYVMVAGADPSDRRYPRSESLYAKSLPQRALFWSGGVIMNVLFALIAFPIVFSAGVSFPAPVVGTVAYGGAAWEAELQPGDRILAIDNKKALSFNDIVNEVALHGHRPLSLRIERDGQEQQVRVEPQFNAEEGLYRIGLSPAYANPHMQVKADGPAAAVGMQEGDQPLRINDEDFLESEAYATALQDGAPMTIEVRRDDVQTTVTIQTPKIADKLPPRIGVTTLARQVIGLRRGVPLLERLAVRRGDVVLAIDGRPFLGGDLEAYAVGPNTLRLHIARNGKELVLEQSLTAAERADLANNLALGKDESLRVLPVENTPAATAGLLAGDLIETVDGEAIAAWSDLQEAVENGEGKPLRFVVRRLSATTTDFFDAATGELPRGELVELTITPQVRHKYDYGFTPVWTQVQTIIQAEGFGDSLRLGTVCSLDLIKQTYVTLKRMITGDVGAKNLGGIVRISEFSYRAAERGPSWFWYFLGLISLNLAFVNLLPIPVLDGGHLLFLVIEKVKGSPVSSRVFGYSQVIGLVFVLLLVVFVTYNDIMRYL